MTKQCFSIVYRCPALTVLCAVWLHPLKIYKIETLSCRKSRCVFFAVLGKQSLSNSDDNSGPHTISECQQNIKCAVYTCSPCHNCPACASMLLFTITIQLLAFPTSYFTLLGHKVLEQKINIQMNFCLQAQPHHLLLRHLPQTTGNSLQDRLLTTVLNELPWVLFHRHFGGADLPNKSNFPYSLSITTFCPCCIYLVSFKYHQSIRKYIKNTEGRFSPSAPPQTHTCWGSSITFLLCVLTKASCVTLLWSHTDTCTAAVSVWPTHPAEEMQIYWSALGG